MRVDARSFLENRLHFHDGNTCLGHPTARACAEHAVACGWIGKVLEVEDIYHDGRVVKCYSLIASNYEHHAQHGRYVVEVKLTAAPIIDDSARNQGGLCTMKITVNGCSLDFDDTHITYEEVVDLAGMTGTPSVTYSSKRDGDARREGTMYKGCSPVLLTDAMVFNVTHTGNA